MASEKDGESIKLTTPGGTIDINYHEAGEGREHVIFVQTGGAGTSAYMCWYLNLPVFAKAGYHCFAPDVPGFGRSQITSGQPNRIEFLSAFMAAKNIDRAHFIGNSMGSMTITQFGIEKPERVKSIILTGGESRGWRPKSLVR
jgi:pimeloyl-ACP methyl ester carboxylesterase